MKNYILLFSILLGSVCLSSCELDDWDEPTAEISGQVIDAITGEPLQSEQPEGYQINLVEEGYTKPSLFWGMADGNFKNTRLFPLTFKVKPTNGPFVDPETQTVTLPKTGMTFTVQPYVNISGTASILNDTLVQYSVNLKKGAGAKIIQLNIIIAVDNPRVCINANDFKGPLDVSNIPDNILVATTHTGTVPTVYFKAVKGKTYYVRFAAKTSSSGRYNYSKPIKIDN